MTLKYACGLVLVAGIGLTTANAAFDASVVAPAEMAPQSAESLLISLERVGDHLLAVGSRGHILRSNDNGASWTQVPSPVNNLLTEIYFVDEQRGWIVGHDATILATDDGGTTWAVQHFDETMEPLFDLTFFDAQRGVAIGAYGLTMVTADGGKTWEMVESEFSADGMHLNAITKLNDGSYFIVGEGGLLAHSQDEGQTWVKLESPYESSFFSVAPSGAKGVIVGGLRGNAFVNLNLAESEWKELETGTVQSVFGIADDEQGGFWMVGLNGSLLHVDAEFNIGKANVKPMNGGDDSLVSTAIGGVAYSDVLSLGDTLVIVGGAGVQRMAVSR